MKIEDPFTFLTLDLTNVTDEQRRIFYAKLEELHWRKSADVTTAWVANWTSACSEESMLQYARDSVTKAAAAAKVAKYQAFAATCGQPIKWNVG